MTDTVMVGRDGKRWAIYVNGKLVEGGFFSREVAVETSKQYIKS